MPYHWFKYIGFIVQNDGEIDVNYRIQVEWLSRGGSRMFYVI